MYEFVAFQMLKEGVFIKNFSDVIFTVLDIHTFS